MAARVLVVDDDQENLTLVSKILNLEGYEVIVARSGNEAIEKATQQNPDLAILDVQMPDMNGFELCRQLRQPPVNSCMPIVMLTAVGDEADRAAALEAGANDLLSKPFDMDVLRMRTRNLLGDAK